MSKNITSYYTSYYEKDFVYSQTSAIYWITGIVLLVVVFISSTFCIIFYFICVSKARCRRMERNQHYSYQNGLPNNVFILSDLDTSNTNLNDPNSTLNKPPVYENILSSSELDKLPTYSSFRKTKERSTILPEPTTPTVQEA